MAVVVTKLEIARTPEEVFGLAADTNTWLAISPELIDIEPRGPISQGTKGRMTRKEGRRTVEGTWEIVELVQARRIVSRGGDPRMTVSETIEFEPDSDGRTRLTSTMRFEARSTGMRLLLPLMSPMIRRSVRRQYEALKNRAEVPKAG